MLLLLTCILTEATEKTHIRGTSSEFRCACYLKNFNSRVVAQAMCVLGAEMELLNSENWAFCSWGDVTLKQPPQSPVRLVWFCLSRVRKVSVQYAFAEKIKWINKHTYVSFWLFVAFLCAISPEFVSFFHAVAINSVLPVRNSAGPLLQRHWRHLTLQLPHSHHPMCTTQKVESAPRCHGSGRAESRDFTHQWPRVLRYLRLATCVRTLLMGEFQLFKMTPVKISGSAQWPRGSQLVFSRATTLTVLLLRMYQHRHNLCVNVQQN